MKKYFFILFLLLSFSFCQPNKNISQKEVKILFSEILSTNGSTRATAYSMSNKIITANNKIFVAWLDRVADINIKMYDLSNKNWSETVLVGKGVDNHSGPAITMDSKGYLHVVFGPHHGPFQFVRSSKPYDISSWDKLPEFGITATYPSLICGPDDVLHCTYRGGEEPWRIMYQRRIPGESWSEPVELVDSGVKDEYTQYGNPIIISPDGTLHLGFHIYDFHPKGGKYAGYLRSCDNGITWKTADGVNVQLPATPKTDCFIEKGDSLDMRVCNLAIDKDGNPWMNVVHIEAKPRTVKLWHHDGKEWKMQDILSVIPYRNEVLYGTITFDKEGTFYYIATTQDPGAEKWWGDPSLEVVLLTSDDKGTTFKMSSVSTIDRQLPNWMPSIERPYNSKEIGIPSLIFTHGGPGEKLTDGEGTEVIFVKLGK